VSPGPRPTLSIVVPVLDEAPSLAELHDRLARTLKDVGQPYEVIFVDDGSRDGSADVLRDLHARDGAVKVVRFNRNYGQHAAVLAGMERARGDVVVTLDADLQNPPEEIPRLLAALTDGVDVAGGWRVGRRDPWARRAASWAANRLTSAIVGVRLRDYGCMLRAYRRSVVDQIVACPGGGQFIPALGASFATGVAEIPVAHAAREHGRSRYGLMRLLRLMLHILALGPIGEYVGRIDQDVRRRPRYVISEVLE
jgi:undecaprenyl-phosphate 4-deoxy-4-formamido-L-arabinose transferase